MAEADPTKSAKADTAAAEDRKKPEKPDEEAFRAEVAQAEKEHAALMERLNDVKSKIDLAKPSAKSSPAQQRQQELRAELSSIRQHQQQMKASKGNVLEKMKQLDASLKSRMTEQKSARARVPFKNVEELDREIQRLEKQVDAGTMKLVDEKKALAEVSSLRKQRKGFAQFDEAEKGIADTKAQLAELKKTLDDPEAKAKSERYTAITKELDEIKSQQDGAFKNINSLRDERSKLQSEQQEKYGAIRAIKDKYYAQKKAYADYEHEAYKARKERQRAQREAFDRERRKKVADQRLEEASQPAYMDEILSAEGLIRYFDKGAAESTSATTETSKFAAQATRTVEDSDFKGTRVVKKDDREDNYFIGGGGKKKKGRKNGGTASPANGTGTPTEGTASGGKFNLSMGIIEELGKLDIEPPMSQADVPGVLEKLRTKTESWKKDQERQTKANIAKAQKEIDRLEKEGQDSSSVGGDSGSGSNSKEDTNSSALSSPSQQPQPKESASKSAAAAPTNGAGDATTPSKGAGADADTEVDAAAELAAETAAADDVAEELQKADLEDKE